MAHRLRFLAPAALATATALSAATQLSPAPQQPASQQPPRQPSDINLIIGERIGTPPNFAVPDFLALSNDPETVAAAKLIAQVLWDDLRFEREFRLIPRDIYATIPPARSLVDVPFDRWRELGTDGVVIGTVRRIGDDQLQVQARLFNVGSLESALGVEYTGSARNPRLYAHQLSDEIHRHQRGLRGVARTRLAFASDRDQERIVGPVDDRAVKELYIADYDGNNVQRVTVGRSLNIFPVWCAEGQAIAYTSYRRGYQDIFVSYIYRGTLTSPAGGSHDVHNWLSACSPDGSRIAFTSSRDGDPDLYVMNSDGTNVRRITSHPAIDTSPTWSPTGNQLAFTSDRTGAQQIYVIGADGTGLRRLTYESYCSRPTWSPEPYNEIAYASQTGPGFDIKVLDLATNEVRQLTFGLGSNESPAYSPNGRHIAFMSTRSAGGLKQIYTIGRDGRGLRRVTSTGNNEMPSWSP